MKPLDPLLSSKIGQWEEAGASLMSTLQDYMDLCLGLAYNSPIGVTQPSEFATRIDSTLAMVSNQLIQASSTLARMRNRFLPMIHRLPEEILSAIFINVVFDPNFSELPQPPSVKKQTRFIYHRLYTLISVCSTWKDIIMAEGVLWSIVPMVSISSTEKQDFFELCLKRARQSKLHLVAVKNSTNTPKDLLDVLTEHRSQFRMINFSLLDHEVIVDAIGILLQGSTESLTELSIGCTRLGASSSWMALEEDYVVSLNHPNQAEFSNLIGSLTTFRICGAHFYWQTLSFSTRLVELYIESITLGFDHEIYPFLQALSAASGLRDLKIIQLDTFYEPEHTASIETLSPVVLPNLQSLYFENIFFNTLKLLLPMITPGSHRLTLFLNSASLDNNLFDHDIEMIEASEFAHVDITDLCELLEKVPVDTLMLNGRWEQWPTGTTLHRLLKALPTLKTLKLHEWHFDQDSWSNLAQPQSDDTRYPSSLFPALANLQITSATVLTDEGLEDMLASHPLKHVTVGAIDAVVIEGGGQRRPFEVNDLANWLRNNVPDFRLVDDSYVPPEFYPDRHNWEIW